MKTRIKKITKKEKFHKILNKECQKILNIVKEILNVELALITKFGELDIKTIKSKDSKFVDNLLDVNWMENLELEYRLNSFRGLPIKTPDGQIYGFLYIFNGKERNFNNIDRDLLKKIKNIIEKQVENVYLDVLLKEIIKDIEKIRNMNKQLIT